MPYIGQSLTEGTRREYTYVATASQTTFNAIYTVGAVDVYQNGVLLAPSDYTATTGTTVVFNTGAALNDEVTIHCHNTFSVADTVSASQGGTFSGAVTHTGAFTSRGIDDNATSTAMTLDASGNLLVGKTSDSFGTVGSSYRANGSISATASANEVLDLNRLSTDGNIMRFFKDGTTVGSIASKDGDLAIGTGTIGIRFLDGSSAIVPQNHSTNSGTDGLLDIGVGAARFKDLYLSGGVYLGGTGAANLLDDYEEGTWTPANSVNCTVNSILNSKYVKVGNFVNAWAYINVTTTSQGFTLNGMPFTASSSAYGPANIYYPSSHAFKGYSYVEPNSTFANYLAGAAMSGTNIMVFAKYHAA